MKSKYQKTLIACYLGFITQAIAANFAPLLFLTFHRTYQISLGKIAFISTAFFFTQLLVDLFCAKYVDRIGYRRSVVASEILSGCGWIGLAILPELLPDPYVGILISVIIYAIGSGLIEVLVSPIVEACPFENKEAVMSLLHSFYCWGHVAVVILSTVFFVTVGISHWRILTFLWALVPLVNVFIYAGAPIRVLVEEEKALPMGKLFRMKLFWLFFFLMICSGASEQAMSQWASYFAENGLKVSKTMGDLLGPCMFAILMGVSRTFYGIKGEKIPLKKFITVSSILCGISYVIAVFSPNPVLSLAGCALCGLSVGIMWPGVFSLAAEFCPQGGTAMFGLLALAGDIGCGGGPSVVGSISGLFDNNLKAGLFAAIIFPAALLVMVNLLHKKYRA